MSGNGSQTRTPRFEATASGQLRWPGGAHRCALGRGGVKSAKEKREGDGATPLGVWPLRRVFFRPDRTFAPATALPVDPLIREMGWCDDPASGDYNRLIALPFTASHEALWRQDELYDLIIVLGYNDAPPQPGLGSAIFLHVAHADFSPTEGCIATSLDALAALLAEAKRGDELAVTA
jgi:L,D-peptidoglycan transpeptidase YkuD (ErfK/YbiS/YcfS/YnhG family)